MKLDPTTPPMQQAKKEQEVYIPPLPKEAILPDSALKQSENVGQWWRMTSEWAKKRSPMTPHQFIDAMAIWSIGVAVARRCYIGLHEQIYPHLYLLIVAETSRYAKSTGMNLFYNLIQRTMPELLIPGSATTEGMLELLSGTMPSNFEKLLPLQQAISKAGQRYSGQRSIIMDEYSGLLASSKKEYMAGFVELLMRLYDARDLEQYYTRSGGLVTINKPGISILGATTPAAMARALTPEAWENGEMARYLMFFRDNVLPYSNHYEPFKLPNEIVSPLKHLHRILPDINPKANGDDPDEAIGATITKDALELYNNYAKAVRYTLIEDLDPRLAGNYTRLHVQAMKIALSLAIIDAVDESKYTIRPQITAGHWALAHQMVERSRHQLHLLLNELSISADSRYQRDVMNLLKQHRAGLTIREMCRLSNNTSAKSIRSSVEILIESGDIEEIEHVPSGVGRPTKIYRFVYSS